MSFHRSVALRYFRSRKGFVSVVSGFSLFGILLGVAALIVVMSVMNGFRSELMGRILGVSGHATAQVPYADLAQAQTMVVNLSKLPEVQSAEVFVQGQALTMNRGRATGVLLRGIDVQNTHSYVKDADKILSGRLTDLEKPNTIAIGKELARTLQAGVGSVITLVSPSGSTTPFGFIPRMVKVQVVAVFDVGMHIYNNGWVYSSVSTAQKFLQLNDTVSGIDIKLHDPMQVTQIKPTLVEALQSEGAFVMSWKDSNKQFFEALEVERVSMFIILTLIIVVAAFNIITGQTMTVNDKRSDIAILRTMGARRKDILKIFIFGGSMIGFLGTFLGVIFGVLIVMNLQMIVTMLEQVFGVAIFSGEVYFLDNLPAVLNATDLSLIVGISITLSILAAVYPAWRAAKLDPVEVLRSE
tara:strand:- start:217132 stop:218367 length:1236 start_codon:yes stop_codon:yes gene_type:complete